MSNQPNRLYTPGPQPQQPSSIRESLRHHYEVSTIKPAIVMWFFTGFFACSGIVATLLWLLLGALSTPQPAGLAVPARVAFSGPLLQPSPPHPELPWQDLRKYRAHEEHVLHTYARLPGDADHVRIPIARAEALLLQKNLLQTWPVVETLPYVRNDSEAGAAASQPSPADDAAPRPSAATGTKISAEPREETKP